MIDKLRAALNHKQQLFVDEYLKGMSAAQAYEQAGYKTTSSESSAAAASKLLKKVNISNYIEAVRGAEAKTEIAQRDELLIGLTQIFRTGIEVVKKSAGFAEANKSLIKSAISAGKQISKMQGYDAPIEILQKSTDLTDEQLHEELVKKGFSRRPDQLSKKRVQ